MRKGIVKISRYFLQDALHFPLDWDIEEISLVNGPGGDYFEMVISGDGFPESAPIKEFEIIIHQANIRLELKEVRGGLNGRKTT